MDVLRDQVWTFVTLVVTVVFALPTLRAGLKRKGVEYQIQSNEPLLGVEQTAEVAPELELLLDGIRVRRPRLVVLRIKNVGSLPITTDDYEQPLAFQFDSLSTVLHAGVVSSQPPGLRPPISVIDNKVVIQPMLLNPKDAFQLQVLADGKYIKINAEGRIVGLSHIQRVEKHQIGRWNLSFSLLYIAFCCFLTYWNLTVSSSSILLSLSTAIILAFAVKESWYLATSLVGDRVRRHRVEWGIWILTVGIIFSLLALVRGQIG
ncbi:MAG: hypothetical protein M3R24_37520 [Chloroflexota bacterium]|nr:hypothetical protein [Chloroflexota bacterium]